MSVAPDGRRLLRVEAATQAVPIERKPGVDPDDGADGPGVPRADRRW